MGLKCGIVGLPNVGKSTLFNALSGSKAEAANYPFCTIDPNKSVVEVPDPRLNKIAELIKPKKTVPTFVEFVDIAGLVKGASKGEGLGNQFLSHIRDCQAIAHVVRCFEDPNVVHVEGSVNPIRDVEVIETELMLADLASAEKKKTLLEKMVKSNDKKAKEALDFLLRIYEALSNGRPARSVKGQPEEFKLIQDLQLITLKPMLFVGNLDEDTIVNGTQNENPHYKALAEYAQRNGAQVIPIAAKMEADLAEMNNEEKIQFLKDLGIDEPGLHKFIQAAYNLLGLATYFTAGEKEVRAWTIEKGWTAPQAAGVIHSDFERGFIAAVAYSYDDLIKYGSEQKIKEAGLLRTEGKEYQVKDGDILLFRFNV